MHANSMPCSSNQLDIKHTVHKLHRHYKAKQSKATVNQKETSTHKKTRESDIYLRQQNVKIKGKRARESEREIKREIVRENIMYHLNKSRMIASSSSSSSSSSMSSVMMLMLISLLLPLVLLLIIIDLTTFVESATTTSQQQQQPLQLRRGGSGGGASDTSGSDTISRTTTRSLQQEQDDNDNDNDNDCLLETVCSISELETLCGYMITLQSDNSNSSNSNSSNDNGDFITTFFAPNNDAFDSLPALVANDITAINNQNVLRNVIMYHSVISSSEESESESESGPINVNDLICNEELVMALSSSSNNNNNETTTTTTTTTLCFGSDNDNENKVQIGDGNLPMRNLPFIIESNINACNGKTLIHIVNQVILPTLPLLVLVTAEATSTEASTSASTSTTTTTSGEREEAVVEDDVCGGIIETVCSTSELETLCDSLQLLLDEDNNNNLDFLLNVGTFFAPTNNAFDSLLSSSPSIVTLDDIQNDVDILLNVIKYHAVNPTTTNSNSSSSGSLLFYNELECDDQILMVNQETTRTLCLSNTNDNGDENGDENGEIDEQEQQLQQKIQLGFGNMPMRTLPKILTNSDSSANNEIIITCNRNAIIHLVDQVILPSLPLSSGNENGGSLIIIDDDAMIEDVMIEEEQEEEAMIEEEGGGIFEEDTTIDGCGSSSIPPPNTNSRCTNIGITCGYGHVYTGCKWFVLQCTPTTNCICNEDGTWECSAIDIFPCDNDGDGDDDDGTTTTTINFTIDDTDIVDFNNDDVNVTTPWGEECNPEDDLPQPPSSLPEEEAEEEEAMIEGVSGGFPDDDGNVTNSTDDDDHDEVAVIVTTREPAPTPTPVCPDDPNFNGSCQTIGDICDYDHLYTGCTWNELQCSPVISCECFSNGSWGCLIAAQLQCGSGSGSGGSMMFEFQSEFVDEPAAAVAAAVPDGLPWGDRCDPNDDLPQEPPIKNGTDTVDGEGDGDALEGRLIGECPEDGPNFGTCSDTYVSNLICEYDHIYTGCSWDELGCNSVMECECNQFDDGDWACLSFSMMGCDERTTPTDLPWGQSCNPNDDLPLPEPDQQQQPASSFMRDIP